MKIILNSKNSKKQSRIPVNFRLIDGFMILLGLIIFLFIMLSCYIPDTSGPFYPEDDEQIFIIVEKMPEFPGGIDSMKIFINNSIRYPEKYGDVCIQGRVICRFVINEDGSISQPTVLRGIDSDLDAEALRVINTMPNWQPGTQRDKPVKVWYTIPVNFMH